MIYCSFFLLGEFISPRQKRVEQLPCSQGQCLVKRNYKLAAQLFQEKLTLYLNYSCSPSISNRRIPSFGSCSVKQGQERPAEKKRSNTVDLKSLSHRLRGD